MLDLNGRIITNDATGYQRVVAQHITEAGAKVKENQGQLHEGIKDLFEGAEASCFDGVPYDHTATVDNCCATSD